MRTETPPAPCRPEAARPDRERLFLAPAALLTGCLMVLAFPSYGQDYLIWFSLAPLLWAATGRGMWRGLLAGLLAGMLLVGWGFSWVHYAMGKFTGFGVLGSAAIYLPWVLFESLPWAALGLFLGALRRDGRPRPGLVFLCIPFWVGLEHYYPHIFPWHVGGALYDRLFLVQSADLLGASGLTAVVFLVNAVIYLGFLRLQGRARFPLKSLCLALALLSAANLYGWLRLEQVDRALASAPELRVGIVQPVTLPQEKREGNTDLFEKMRSLTWAITQKEKVDLVVWPEAADTVGYPVDPRRRVMVRPQIDRLEPTGFERIEVPLVAGTWSQNPATGMQRNSAELVLPGKRPPAGLYHKNVRLLFGEYVPLLDSMPDWIRSKLDYVGTIEAGTECPLLELPARNGPYHFRILICYEAVLPRYVREAARDADFLVNVTEDIWYGPTSHIGQHLSVLRMRAVEERVSLVRAANVGPSGVIDPSGRMPGATVPFEKTERVFSLRPARLHSFYAEFGFLFPAACLGGLLFLVPLAVRRRGVAPPLEEEGSRTSGAN